MANHLAIERGSDADCQVSDVVMMLVFGVIAGVKHISHMAILRSDEVLRALFKWDSEAAALFCVLSRKTESAFITGSAQGTPVLPMGGTLQ